MRWFVLVVFLFTIPSILAYSNENISITCYDCIEEDDFILSNFFEYQNGMFNCLSEKLGFYPEILYNLSRGYFCDRDMCRAGGGFCNYLGNNKSVVRTEINGIIENNESTVTKLENLRAEMHETMHAFTIRAFEGLGNPWFQEGISIYFQNRVKCHENQWWYDNIIPNWGGWLGDMDYWGTERDYKDLKTGNLQRTLNGHSKGLLFFYGLENDYDCDTECVIRIMKEVEKIFPNDADWIKTNTILKEIIEDEVNSDLTFLFNILDITFEIECEGTNNSCGRFNECTNCNEKTGCYNGYYKNYYCMKTNTCGSIGCCSEECCDSYYDDPNAYCEYCYCRPPPSETATTSSTTTSTTISTSTTTTSTTSTTLCQRRCSFWFRGRCISWIDCNTITTTTTISESTSTTFQPTTTTTLCQPRCLWRIRFSCLRWKECDTTTTTTIPEQTSTTLLTTTTTNCQRTCKRWFRAQCLEWREFCS